MKTYSYKELRDGSLSVYIDGSWQCFITPDFARHMGYFDVFECFSGMFKDKVVII